MCGESSRKLQGMFKFMNKFTTRQTEKTLGEPLDAWIDSYGIRLQFKALHLSSKPRKARCSNCLRYDLCTQSSMKWLSIRHLVQPVRQILSNRFCGIRSRQWRNARQMLTSLPPQPIKSSQQALLFWLESSQEMLINFVGALCFQATKQ